MQIEHIFARPYETTLKNYFHVLQIREEAGALPEEFDQKMEQFIAELNELIAEEKAKEFRHAA